MDVFLDKKNNNPLSPWSTRCYKIRNCELTQYKKECDAFKRCKDESIKRRYNICDIEQILLTPKMPYILKLNIPSKYQQNTVNVLLKLNNVNANINKKKNQYRSNSKDVDHALFIAIYRLLSSSIKSDSECLERPLQSNICMALYYLLQRLYKHKAIQSTQRIFKKRFPLKFVEKLYYDLIVNCKRFLSLDQEDLNNIHLLSHTLLYTLQHMPASLFCDSYCKELTDFVINTMDDDIDYNSYKIAQIKQFFVNKYSAKKAKYFKKHQFHSFNRYGFMTILFLLLHTISNKENIDTTGMSPCDLAEIFGPCLQSKRYLYLCRRHDLSKNKKYHDKVYEAQFNRMIQVLIEHAHVIFPDLQHVQWNIQALIHAQGQEKYMIEHYNDQFSLNAKNEYYIAPILLNNKTYGDFDGELYEENTLSSYASDDEENEDETMSGCARCSKHCLFFVNFVMLLIGVTAIAFAVFQKENAERDIFGFGSVDDSFIYLSIACGVLIIIISFLGCVGASTDSKCILVIFIALLTLSLILELVAVIFVFTATDDLKKIAENQWDSLSLSKQKEFEEENGCCGFETEEGSECIAGSIGCYDMMEHNLQSNFMIIGWICIGVFIYQLGLACFGCFLCKKIPPMKYSRV